MQHLISFHEQQGLFDSTIEIKSTNVLNGKTIETRKINPANKEVYKRNLLIRETAAIVYAFIKQREKNYYYAGHHDPRKKQALSALYTKAQLLPSFTCPDKQIRYISEKMHKHFFIIAPRDPHKFPSFHKFIQCLESPDHQANLQTSLI